MPIAGAAAGAARSLEELVAAQILKQKLQEEIANREQQTQIEQARLNETMRNNDFDRQRTEKIDAQNATDRQRGMDREDTERRGRSNMAQVIAMGVDPQTAQREVAFSSLNSGADVPSGVAKLLEGPPAPQKVQYTYTDPKTGRKSLRFANKDEVPEGGLDMGDEPQRPTAGPQPDYEWVVGKDGQPRQIRKGSAQPGDRPYEKGGSDKPAGPSPYATERAGRTVQSVDELMGKVNRWTTGFGSLLANLPESDALDFESQLDTLKANIAFNELAQMREASKTGGALGAVSEREMQLLQSTLGALNAKMKPESLKAQLQKVKESVNRWQEAQGVKPVTVDDKAPNAGANVAEIRYERDPQTGKLVRVGG